MSDKKGNIRIFVTCDIGGKVLDRLREHGQQMGAHDQLKAPPKNLILEEVLSGIACLISTSAAHRFRSDHNASFLEFWRSWRSPRFRSA